MKIFLSPCVMEAELDLEVKGSTLLVNGDPIDFSPLEEGDLLPFGAIENKFVLSAVRKGGRIEVTVIFPIKEDATDAQVFPRPITANAGKVKLP